MPLSLSASFAPSDGATVAVHGCKGIVHPRVTVVDSFRRPGATMTNYQTTGSNSVPSKLAIWYGGDTYADIEAKRAKLCGLAGKLCSLVRSGMTTVKVVVTGVEISGERRTGGSKSWLLEASITVEASP